MKLLRKPLSDKDEAMVDSCIEQLICEHGVATDMMLLNMARDTYHPLHRLFNWDGDGIMAEISRLDEAFVRVCRLNSELKSFAKKQKTEGQQHG